MINSETPLTTKTSQSSVAVTQSYPAETLASGQWKRFLDSVDVGPDLPWPYNFECTSALFAASRTLTGKTMPRLIGWHQVTRENKAFIRNEPHLGLL